MKIGNVVRVKGIDGPLMTVNGISETEIKGEPTLEVAHCVWFDQLGNGWHLHSEPFCVDTLVLVRE